MGILTSGPIANQYIVGNPAMYPSQPTKGDSNSVWTGS